MIGNADYPAAPLPTAAADAGLVARSLASVGFDVTAGMDLDAATLRQTVDAFRAKVAAVSPNAIVFVYLAGYGLQYDGTNVVVPIDARVARVSDVPREAVGLSGLLQGIDAAPLAARTIVLDLARESPFAKGDPPLAGGLAMTAPPPDTLLAFNAAPGAVGVPDIAPYGMYAKALAEMIVTPGLSAEALFRRLRLRVGELTDGAVVPWNAGSLDRSPLSGEAGSPPAMDDAAPLATMLPATAYSTAIARDRFADYLEALRAFPTDSLAPRLRLIAAVRREALFWMQCLRAKTGPAFWTYMRRYPRGPHFGDARRFLAALRAPLEPPPRFDILDFDAVPPPLADEAVALERRNTTFDAPGSPSIPIPPDDLLPPRGEAFYDDLSPPLVVPAGILPLPPPDGGPPARGLVEQAGVPRYGTVAYSGEQGTDGARRLTLRTGTGAIIVSAERTEQPTKSVVVETDAHGALVSRIETTRTATRLQSVQTGPTGSVLLRVLSQDDSVRGRSTVVSDGDGDIVGHIQTDIVGIVTVATRGPVPARATRFLLEPALDAKGTPKVIALASRTPRGFPEPPAAIDPDPPNAAAVDQDRAPPLPPMNLAAPPPAIVPASPPPARSVGPSPASAGPAPAPRPAAKIVDTPAAKIGPKPQIEPRTPHDLAPSAGPALPARSTAAPTLESPAAPLPVVTPPLPPRRPPESRSTSRKSGRARR